MDDTVDITHLHKGEGWRLSEGAEYFIYYRLRQNLEGNLCL